MLESKTSQVLEEVLMDLEGDKVEIELNRELHALIAELMEVDTKFKTIATDRLKAALRSPSVLQVSDYGCGKLIVLTVDASPFAASWAIG
ncbi:unnamed protein product [Calypogeia fissa]